MKAKILLLSLFFPLAFSNIACDAAYSITATKIRDILDHPRDYQSKEITVYGTVTNAVSLLVIKYYEIQDDTGSIKVVTDNLLPARGEKLSVTGRTTVVEVGTERWVVLRENPDSTIQAVDSKNAGGVAPPQY
jgi:aspartyl/asparaginyl-tRNA synthetase